VVLGRGGPRSHSGSGRCRGRDLGRAWQGGRCGPGAVPGVGLGGGKVLSVLQVAVGVGLAGRGRSVGFGVAVCGGVALVFGLAARKHTVYGALRDL